MQMISRQRIWQEKKKKQGLCINCGAPRVKGSKNHCEECRDKAAERALRRAHERRGKVFVDK